MSDIVKQSDKVIQKALVQRKRDANTFKASGNNAFKGKKYDLAIQHFTKAIELIDNDEAFYSNRSAAYMKLGDFKRALQDGEKCIELKPDWGKGYSRSGSALFALKEYQNAVSMYAKGIAKDPSNKLLLQGLQSSQTELTKQLEEEKKRNPDGHKLEDGEEKDDVEQDEHVIGIDLGTTNSCVGVWQGDSVTIISTNDGDRTIPSYVAFNPKDGSRLTGRAAKAQVTRNPKNTLYDVKRIIGQRFTDTGVEQDVRRFHFDVKKGEDDKPVIQVQSDGKTKELAPEEVSAMVLTTCKQLAEKFLGAPVTKAVITVPAYFNDSQRNATKAAGRIAGLEVLRIINEPTAAALAYGLDMNSQKKRKTKANRNKNNKNGTQVLVFDLGGGTFDVSILSIQDGIFTVKATGGDTRLGGEDFDNQIVDYLIPEIEKAIGDPRKDDRAMSRIRKASENVKRDLSNSQSAEIRMDSLLKGKDFTFKMTRQKLESLNETRFTMCMDTVRRVLKDAKMKTPDIDEIVLVGGSTRIPKLQAMLREMFDGKPLCKSVNPDEAVAFGAAVQGAILNGKRNSKTDDLLLMDVTPLSLGIETSGRVMSVIIPRNTPIPCVKTQTYTTEHNYQTKVDISVYEGERLKSDENNLLGEFTISGIESAKRGEPQVDVAFSLDSNGILTVTAKDQKTNAVAAIEIANRSRASESDIEKMVQEAKRFETEDRERIAKAEARNELESTINEVMDIASGVENGKIGQILQDAAEKAQEWLDDHGSTAKASEMNKRRRELARRVEGRR